MKRPRLFFHGSPVEEEGEKEGEEQKGKEKKRRKQKKRKRTELGEESLVIDSWLLA